MNNPFDSMLPSYEEYESSRQGNYEDGVVKFILNKIGKKEFEQEIRELGDGLLQFHNMESQLGFPMWCVVYKIRGVHKEMWGTNHLSDSLYHRVTKLPLYRTWDAAKEDMPSEREGGPHGVIFAWPGRAKFTVLHNRPVPPQHGRGEYMCLNNQIMWVKDLEDLLKEFGPYDSW